MVSRETAFLDKYNGFNNKKYNTNGQKAKKTVVSRETTQSGGFLFL